MAHEDFELLKSVEELVADNVEELIAPEG